MVYKSGAGLDAIPHLLLVIMISRIGGMLSVLTVCPGLHPTELCGRLIGTDGIDEHREPGFVTIAHTAVMAGLLKRDIIVLSVPKCITEGNRVTDDTSLAVSCWLLAIRTYSMAVRSGIFEQELSMLLQ